MNIHHRAKAVSIQYKKAESELIFILQELDQSKAYLELEMPSLFSYCTDVLASSNDVTASFIAVARRAKQVPLLQTAIKEGLEISKARRITAVISPENQESWVGFAKTLSCKELESKVRAISPFARQKDRVRVIDAENVELQITVSKTTGEKLRRVQDLESKERAATLEQALDAALNPYLKMKDPVEKAKRSLERRERSRARHVAPNPSHVASHAPSQNSPIPSALKNEIHYRDQSQCTHHKNGKRCENSRFLHIHHVIPRAEGGTNKPENLTLLCSAHHRMLHP